MLGHHPQLCDYFELDVSVISLLAFWEQQNELVLWCNTNAKQQKESFPKSSGPNNMLDLRELQTEVFYDTV